MVRLAAACGCVRAVVGAAVADAAEGATDTELGGGDGGGGLGCHGMNRDGRGGSAYCKV